MEPMSLRFQCSSISFIFCSYSSSRSSDSLKTCVQSQNQTSNQKLRTNVQRNNLLVDPSFHPYQCYSLTPRYRDDLPNIWEIQIHVPNISQTSFVCSPEVTVKGSTCQFHPASSSMAPRLTSSPAGPVGSRPGLDPGAPWKQVAVEPLTNTDVLNGMRTYCMSICM